MFNEPTSASGKQFILDFGIECSPFVPKTYMTIIKTQGSTALRIVLIRNVSANTIGYHCNILENLLLKLINHKVNNIQLWIRNMKCWVVFFLFNHKTFKNFDYFRDFERS